MRSKIGYIRKEIPEFDIPAYEGERYEDLVPDTLDLQERAALAVNGLTGPTDPLADYEIYFMVYLLHNPPMMQHCHWDNNRAKFMEALPLMRIVSGSDLNSKVDIRWMESLLHKLGPDGLVYWPTKGRPWTLRDSGYDVEPEIREGEAAESGQHIYPFCIGRLLSAMMIYHRRDGGRFWKETAERLVDGMVDLAIDRGRYAYFSPSPYWAIRGSTEEDGSTTYPRLGAENRFTVLGLVHVYRETGYEPAIDLAKKLVTYILEEVQYFDSEGRFLPDSSKDEGPGLGCWNRVHFHTHVALLQTLLEYVMVAGDRSLVGLIREGFEYAKAHGNTLLGYFPEALWAKHPPRVEGWKNTSELCQVADMIALGLKLCDAQLGDHWDDVDRWARNMFAEGQLTSTDWISRMHDMFVEGQLERTEFAWADGNPPIGPYGTKERVAERNLGAFAGFPTANDWFTGTHGWGIMHCCTGNGTRAIYYLWDHILTHEDGKLRVNLLLNRPSPWADIHSHIPYTGQVDVKVKQAVELSIRIPEWVSPSEVRCLAAGVERPLGWDGRYAQVGGAKPGDVITLTFPIAERTDVVNVDGKEYTLIRKGNEVVHIDPPGRCCPLYQREHYRVNTTRWRKVRRFVSKEILHW